jgi:hypothetical protein
MLAVRDVDDRPFHDVFVAESDVLETHTVEPSRRRRRSSRFVDCFCSRSVLDDPFSFPVIEIEIVRVRAEKSSRDS